MGLLWTETWSTPTRIESGESVCVSNNGRADRDSAKEDTLHCGIGVDSRVNVGDGTVVDIVGGDIVAVSVTAGGGDTVGALDWVLCSDLEGVFANDWVSECAVGVDDGAVETVLGIELVLVAMCVPE